MAHVMTYSGLGGLELDYKKTPEPLNDNPNGESQVVIQARQDYERSKTLPDVNVGTPEGMRAAQKVFAEKSPSAQRDEVEASHVAAILENYKKPGTQER